jgi:histidinol-phosphate aminotransferase
MKIPVPDYILAIDPYVPGKPIEALEREYGIANSVKLASNENPLGPSPKALAAIRAAAAKLHRYPDGGAFDLVHKLAERLDVAPGRIVLGNGSDEIIGLLANALVQPGDEVVIPRPSFLMYEIAARAAGATPVFVPLEDRAIALDRMRAAVTARTRIIFLCNPNNPTGSVFSKRQFEGFLRQVPDHALVVLDEAYIEFARSVDCARGADFRSQDLPLAVLRTFSKAYGLAGLRIGYGVMPLPLADILQRIRPPFNASVLAQAGALAALDDREFLEKSIRLIHEEIDFLQGALEALGMPCRATEANFFLIDVPRPADDLFEAMLRQGVIVRSMRSYGYPNTIRINAGLHEENLRFLDALKTVLAESPGR